MITKTVQEQTGSNDQYYPSSEVAAKSVRAMFEAIQMGLGNHNNIRIRRHFVDCTVNGTVIEYSHKGNTVTVVQRPYDAQIILDGEVEDYHRAAYWNAIE